MYRVFVIVLFFAFCTMSALGQSSREKARKLFLDGNYVEAKPLFEILLKKSPKDGSLNYWYAVCCYETNDTVADIEKMLKYSITRRVNNAHRYLGDFYKRKFRYDEAVESYENFLQECKDEELAILYQERCDDVKRLQRMIKTTERVAVIDSFIVNKERFLSAYRTGRDVGSLFYASEYFDNPNISGSVFITERGTDLYFPRQTLTEEGNKMKLYHSTNVNGEWGNSKQLLGIETYGNDNYPFMAVDGSTFYFASDGEGSIGGYDIFVTRYDSESGTYLKPENMGMPFNSEANDYMLVVNEIANLGWFATDRRMKEGEVCIYVFIPNKTKITYNYESEDAGRMLNLSRLASIVDTHDDKEAVRKARQRLLMLMYEQKEEIKQGDFLFVIDDLTEYTRLDNFKNDEAKKMYENYVKRMQKYEKDSLLLEQRRDKYASAKDADKLSMKNSLLEMEQRVFSEADSLREMEILIRKKEKEYLMK